MDHESFSHRASAVASEKKLQWIPVDHPDAREITNIALGLIKWRNDIVDLVAEETSADRNVRTMNEQIQSRLNELKACGIPPENDGILNEQISLRKLAGNNAAFSVIDHPLVQWVLEAKSKKMKELRERCRSHEKTHGAT